MAEPSFDVADAHRWFAIETNNAVWNWLEAMPGERDPTDPMVHAAHASYHHWIHAGTAIHAARAAMLVANVHAAIGNARVAHLMAVEAAALLGEAGGDATDWDHAFALDAIARAGAAADDPEAATLKAAARTAGDTIAVPDNKAVFDSWFETGNWHGV